ncbi:YybH family protein [Spongiactinospora sp. 9N601]|uniref:YybH family protein n=1 Tax=Spongiactinospora sp. 9N601 TaxID=3375149 RepID=UPI00379E4215
MNTHDTEAEPLTALHAHLAAYVAAFNAGDAQAVDRMYEQASVVVPSPGTPMTGPARVAATRHLLSWGLPIEATPRHVYVSGDIALLIVDWAIRGTTSDGIGVDLSGTSTDVVRQGSDGRWRYVMDNPFGTALAPERGSGTG